MNRVIEDFFNAFVYNKYKRDLTLKFWSTARRAVSFGFNKVLIGTIGKGCRGGKLKN